MYLHIPHVHLCFALYCICEEVWRDSRMVGGVARVGGGDALGIDVDYRRMCRLCAAEHVFSWILGWGDSRLVGGVG
jgi:hypothetical protein